MTTKKPTKKQKAKLDEWGITHSKMTEVMAARMLEYVEYGNWPTMIAPCEDYTNKASRIKLIIEAQEKFFGDKSLFYYSFPCEVVAIVALTVNERGRQIAIQRRKSRPILEAVPFSLRVKYTTSRQVHNTVDVENVTSP